MENFKKTNIKIRDLIAKSWDKKDFSTLFQRCYKIANVTEEDFKEPQTVMVLDNVIVIILYGSVHYLPSPKINIVNGKIELQDIQKNKVETGEGGYLIFLTPIYKKEKENSFKEGIITTRIEIACGYLEALLGKSISYFKVFENEIYGLPKTRWKGWST